MAALKALLMFSSQLGRFTAETCVNYNLEVTRSLCSAKKQRERKPQNTLEIELKSLPSAITFYGYELSFYWRKFIR